MTRPQHVAVVGAGAFGGWTALSLLERGHQVTLIDAWGAGNARASSGGDTRVLRHGYGDDRLYVDMALRSRALYTAAEERWGVQLFERTGLLWLVQQDDAFERASLPQLAAAGVEHAVLDVDTVAAAYPQIDLSGIAWVLTERDAGILYARRTCAAVWSAAGRAGAELLVAAAHPGPLRGGKLAGLELSNGSRCEADAYVFACGPWLGELFPDLGPGPLLQVTRQEVFTFGTPPGDTAHRPPALPVWADHGEHFWYGIPGNDRRGFKLGDDTRGPAFDPTHGDRSPSASGLAAARDYLAFRFPALADAPLLESRVCQYADTADGDFLVDRHPGAHDVWLVGGGSGHAFKHGPALGELVAGCVSGERLPEPRFALARLLGKRGD